MNGYYCADFETNTTEESILEHPVWLWAFAPVGAKDEKHVQTGNDISTFLQRVFYTCAITGDITVFFHNLKFDGNFIIPQLLIDGYEYVTKMPKKASSQQAHTFNVLRSANGAMYTITVCIMPGHLVVFRDSLKIIVGSIKSMPKLFGFEGDMEKLPFAEDDYTRIRPYDYEPDAYEVKYCMHDVLVLCRALQELHKANFNFECLTTGAYAWESVCENLIEGNSGEQLNGKKPTRSTFKTRMFSMDESEWLFAREAYYGGITVCNPKYQGKLLEETGRTDDVNSMYPTVMRYYPLPYGKGTYITGCPIGVELRGKNGGKLRKRNDGTLWIARLTCHMGLKPNQVPIFTPKCSDPENPFVRLWTQGERVVNTRERSDYPIEIVITSVDWENLNHHYKFTDVTWVEAYLYPSRNDLFAHHVDKYTAMKVESKKKGLKGQTYVAKLCLNSAYGKLGQRSYLDELTPYVDSTGKLQWENHIDLKGSIYKKGRPMHMAAFITSWARHILCEHIRAVGYDRFCYADTDSVHYLGTEAPEGTEIDPTKLGAWDNESIWTRAKFVRPKAYYEVFEDGTHNIKLAGCPNNLLSDVTIDEFDIGLTVHGKKRPVIVPRGVMLETSDYTFTDKPGWGER